MRNKNDVKMAPNIPPLQAEGAHGPDSKQLHPLFERLAFLGIVWAQLRAPLKPLNTTRWSVRFDSVY